MNDRTVILKDMSKINEIKVTYFVMTEEEYLEEDSDCESEKDIRVFKERVRRYLEGDALQAHYEM